MNRQMALCLDSESCQRPELIGLADENLEGQEWLTIYNDAFLARDELRKDTSCNDVWVISSDNIDAINLAAALKHDREERQVNLVSFDGSGSVMGRAEAAGVEIIMGRDEFQRRYATKKQRCLDSQLSSLVLEEPEVALADRSPECAVVEEDVSPELYKDKTPLAEELSVQAVRDPSVPQRSSFHPEMRIPQVDSLAESIACATFERTATETDAFVVAVVSGSGGSGKSTLAASMAVYYQMAGRKTLLLDADLQFGDMCYLLGLESALDITELMADPRRVELLKGKGSLPAVLASPKRLEQSELVIGRMSEMISYLKGYFDIIVINTGAFWSEQHAQILETADKSLFIIDQRPSSLRGCSHALELCTRCGIATQSFMYLLNFCSRQAMFTSLDVSCALQGIHVDEINDGGKEVQDLLGSGMPVDLLASKNPFAKSVRELCAKLLALPPDSLQPADNVSELTSKKIGWFSGFRKRRAACL